MRANLLILAILLALSNVKSHSGRDLAEETWVRDRCFDMFRKIDGSFSRLITLIRDPVNPQFNATIREMYDCCLKPDFIYTLNGNPLTGFDGVYSGVLRQVNDFIKRWTRPPVPRNYPEGIYNERHGQVIASYYTDIEHDYINATDLNYYFRVSNHFFYCGGDLDEPDNSPDSLRMINASLTTLASIKIVSPAV